MNSTTTTSLVCCCWNSFKTGGFCFQAGSAFFFLHSSWFFHILSCYPRKRRCDCTSVGWSSSVALVEGSEERVGGKDSTERRQEEGKSSKMKRELFHQHHQANYDQHQEKQWRQRLRGNVVKCTVSLTLSLLGSIVICCLFSLFLSSFLSFRNIHSHWPCWSYWAPPTCSDTLFRLFPVPLPPTSSWSHSFLARIALLSRWERTLMQVGSFLSWAFLFLDQTDLPHYLCVCVSFCVSSAIDKQTDWATKKSCQQNGIFLFATVHIWCLPPLNPSKR